MNPTIIKLITGKKEAEAVLLLKQFNKAWRILLREGQCPAELGPERNDKRYGLIIANGVVERVLSG